MTEQQPEEKTEQKPRAIPEKHAENIDDVLAARTIEEILKETAKKLPQEDKQAGGSSQSDRQARSRMFISPINSVVFSSLGATVLVLWCWHVPQPIQYAQKSSLACTLGRVGADFE